MYYATENELKGSGMAILRNSTRALNITDFEEEVCPPTSTLKLKFFDTREIQGFDVLQDFWRADIWRDPQSYLKLVPPFIRSTKYLQNKKILDLSTIDVLGTHITWVWKPWTCATIKQTYLSYWYRTKTSTSTLKLEVRQFSELMALFAFSNSSSQTQELVFSRFIQRTNRIARGSKDAWIRLANAMCAMAHKCRFQFTSIL